MNSTQFLAYKQVHVGEQAQARAASAKLSGEAARQESDFLAPLHQNPSRRIALLFVARARDSKVRLLASYAILYQLLCHVGLFS